MTNETNETNKTNGQKKSGYQNLIVYQLAVVIYDLNHKFCQRFINSPRTKDQMEQASRSGKQNIVEASLEKSLKMNIKLTGVSRGSFGELLEDYKDFLRVRGLKQWGKDDPRVVAIRRIRVKGANETDGTNGTNETDGTNGTNGTDWTNWTYDPERFANLMITLISKENYLLDKMIQALERKFIQEGGYSENLSQKRLEEKKRQLSGWTKRRWD
jgi:four helix bundle suffix protein